VNGAHAPVLHDEAIAALAIRPDGNYVDGTYGRGGHASSILALLGEHGRLIVMDRDPQAIADAHRRLGDDSRVTIIHDDYANLHRQLAALRRSSTTPSAVSAFSATGRSTCA
jgi:16S rRNA (cytosine1402-N4)-methyltransferase